jgi:peptidyl-prolyl cis-trans isomerase SurA
MGGWQASASGLAPFPVPVSKVPGRGPFLRGAGALDLDGSAPTMPALMRVLFVLLLLVALNTPASAQKVVSDGIAVVVNEAVITYQDVEQYIGQAVELLRAQFARQPEAMRQRISETRQDGTEQLVERQLILSDFKTSGFQFPESIIEDSIQERIKVRFRDRVTFIQTLRERGQTYESFHKQQYDEIVVEAMRRRNVPQDIVISPQKILDFYETNKTNFAVGDRVKLRMIVLNKPAGDTGAVKQLAEEILLKIKEGAAFADMAKIHSEGPQKNVGGDWGWAERDTLRKELAEVAFTLQAGERSGVIDLPDSCWIMLVEDRRVAQVKPLSEVREEIERILRQSEGARLQKLWITKLKSKAFVRYF